MLTNCATLRTVLSLVAAAACAQPPQPRALLEPEMKTGFHWDRDADLSSLRTFNCRRCPELDSVDDPRIDIPLLEKRIREAVTAGLRSRGYEWKEAGQVDFHAAYCAVLTEKLSGSSAAARRAAEDPWRAERQSATATLPPGTYEQGTLILEIVDASSSRPLWQGWVHTKVRPDVDSEQRKTERINRGVALLLERFPPSPAPAR